jgi:hypothetical protein
MNNSFVDEVDEVDGRGKERGWPGDFRDSLF